MIKVYIKDMILSILAYLIQEFFSIHRQGLHIMHLPVSKILQ